MRLSDTRIQQLKAAIDNSLELLYQNDPSLMTRDGMEQSAAFRFAIYLHEEIKELEWINGLNLDIEYNKNGVNPKRTPRRPRGTKPDLIIHNRGNNNSNVLIVEIKGCWNREPREIDRAKLEDFTSQEGEYQYGLGAFIELERESSTPIYFQDY